MLYATKLQDTLIIKIKEILDDHRIFDDKCKDIPNSIDEFKKVYKEFTENCELSRCYRRKNERTIQIVQKFFSIHTEYYQEKQIIFLI